MFKLKIKPTLIITTSAPTQDISNLLFLKAWKQSVSSYNLYIIYFLNKPAKIINNNPQKVYQFICNKQTTYIEVNSSYISRLLCLIRIILIKYKLLSLRFLLNMNNIKKRGFLTIVQPRPFWLKERFGILGNLIGNYKTILIGDGVGSECLTKRPEWLSKDNKRLFTNETIDFSYFVFSAPRISNNAYLKDISFYQYSRQELNECFKEYSNFILNTSIGYKVKSFIEELSSYTKELHIVLSTTFAEYERCSFANEINLYQDIINGILSSKSSGTIIIKTHPLSSDKKNKTLLNIQKKLIDSKEGIKKTVIDNFNLISAIPIEVLSTILISKKIKITFYASSSAVIPSIYAYSSIKHKILFGKEKIEGYFTNKDEINKRNSQEEKISKLCFKTNELKE